jgi:lytic murein transglycosylase
VREGKTRRQIVTGLAGLGLGLAERQTRAAANPGFSVFLQSLWRDAQAKGVRRSTFDAALVGLTPDTSLPKASGTQAEFDKPLQTYFREAVSARRIAEGMAFAAQYANTIGSIESRFGVPGEICLAAWGMESDFGRSKGDRDIIRTLATLAFTRPDRPVFRDEFVAALVILDRGDIPRERLRGSWAGAMGDPQFLPSAYLKYAVNIAGGTGAPNIWSNTSDTLGSVANFLRAEGWVPNQPWIEEVVIPLDFDFRTLHAGAAEWARLGLRRSDGRAPEGDGDAALFLPSGAAGPAFLLFANYFVIKQYNNSDSYALSLGILARRIAGSPGTSVAWPVRPINLSRTEKIFVQTRLAALGLYDGPRDGKFGPKARDAIHAYQRAVGLVPADGFATPTLVSRLKTSGSEMRPIPPK